MGGCTKRATGVEKGRGGEEVRQENGRGRTGKKKGNSKTCYLLQNDGVSPCKEEWGD